MPQVIWEPHFEEELLSDFDEVDLKDIDTDELDYEYSVVRSDNPFGKESWGWGGDNKIILFDLQTNPTTNREWAKKVVIAFAHMLNEMN